MNTTARLTEKYGVLLNIGQVAEILQRTPDGLRFTLRGNSALAQKLRPGRLKIGRRILFKADVVASIIDHGVEE